MHCLAARQPPAKQRFAEVTSARGAAHPSCTSFCAVATQDSDPQTSTPLSECAQVESEARNPYTALKRRYATLQRNALHVQNALVRPLHALHLQLHKQSQAADRNLFSSHAAICLQRGGPGSFHAEACLYIARVCSL